jgi:ferredoxin
MARNNLPPFFARLRFATSVISTWLLNLNLFGFSLKNVCSPGFNCHGCPWATAACPVGVMAYGSAMHTIPLYAIASVLAVGAVAGRLVCSFVCPFGLLQDLLFKIPFFKIKLPRFFRYGKYAALVLLVFLLPWLLGFDVSGYLVLAKPQVNKIDGGNLKVDVTVSNDGAAPVKGVRLTVIYRGHDPGKTELAKFEKSFPDVTVAPAAAASIPGFEIPNRLSEADLEITSPQSEIRQHARYQLYYCNLCPNGTLTSTIPAMVKKSSETSSFYSQLNGRTLRLGILAGFLILMVISSRPVCRLFCPLGAMYAMTTKLSLARMELNHDQCVECGACSKVCPVDLNVMKEVGGAECIACGDCMKVCPKNGIRRKFGL